MSMLHILDASSSMVDLCDDLDKLWLWHDVG
jgi:hypothetical protein